MLVPVSVKRTLSWARAAEALESMRAAVAARQSALKCVFIGSFGPSDGEFALVLFLEPRHASFSRILTMKLSVMASRTMARSAAKTPAVLNCPDASESR